MEKITTAITEIEHAGMRLFAARTGTKDVVSIEGSMYGGWNMLPHDKSEVPEMVTELLDAGTAKKSKDTVREALGAKGVSISFSAGGDRTYFAASCLPEDITFALETIVECLTEATFPAAEIKTAKARALGDLIEAKSETRSVAARTLSRMIYDPSHVNYAETIDEQKKSIQGITRADLLAFRKTLGQGGLVFAITGDISPEATLKSAIKVLSKLPKGTQSVPEKLVNKKKPTAQTQTTHITDKANIDIYAGMTMQLNSDDALYRPFIILTEMLGGRGFTSHLMQTIRERDGLTYGVYSMPSGFSDKADGAFRIWATFSPNKFEESVAALKKEISIFFKSKVTAKGLLARQEEIIGGYAVGLSTSRGLASMLHKVGIDGKQLSYIDEYPELVKEVTLEDIQEVAKLISVDKLAIAAAGTFLKTSLKKK